MDRLAFIALRKGYGLTQEAMGRALGRGYSRQAVIKWEKGLHPLPDDIESLLIKANLALPAAQKDAGKAVTPTSHPECYRSNGASGKHLSFYRTLAHPKWWAGVASPFSKLCAFEDWSKIDAQATELELSAYQPPSIEQARALMMARGITLADANEYLATMGHIAEVVKYPEWQAYWRAHPGGSETHFREIYPNAKTPGE